jgi:hypothetical protein
VASLPCAGEKHTSIRRRHPGVMKRDHSLLCLLASLAVILLHNHVAECDPQLSVSLQPAPVEG